MRGRMPRTTTLEVPLTCADATQNTHFIAALRLTPLGVSTTGFSEFQVCNSSASSITVSDPVKVLTFR
jgi:hypothetical protein